MNWSNRGFAVPCLTTWLWRHMQPCTNRADINGAGNEARTRYLHLGKVALYQMSYARGTKVILAKTFQLVKAKSKVF